MGMAKILPSATSHRLSAGRGLYARHPLFALQQALRRVEQDAQAVGGAVFGCKVALGPLHGREGFNVFGQAQAREARLALDFGVEARNVGGLR